MSMKGFKPMGRGAVKYTSSFPSKTPCGPQGCGSSNSCRGMSSCKTMVRSHTKSKPKYASGGMVDSATVKRERPVTSADAEAGGRSELRPGYAKGGPAAPRKPPVPPGRGKKMATAAARLMKQGFTREVAEAKCGGGASMTCGQKYSRGGMACGSKRKKCS